VFIFRITYCGKKKAGGRDAERFGKKVQTGGRGRAKEFQRIYKIRIQAIPNDKDDEGAEDGEHGRARSLASDEGVLGPNRGRGGKKEKWRLMRNIEGIVSETKAFSLGEKLFSFSLANLLKMKRVRK